MNDRGASWTSSICLNAHSPIRTQSPAVSVSELDDREKKPPTRSENHKQIQKPKTTVIMTTDVDALTPRTKFKEIQLKQMIGQQYKALHQFCQFNLQLGYTQR